MAKLRLESLAAALALLCAPLAAAQSGAADGEERTATSWLDGFKFGTYGRVGIAWDGRGGTAQPFSVVSHGPRLEQRTSTSAR
jgi:hypothetical protein